MVSSISQVVSERIDQSRSVLFLVRHSKDFRGYQKVHNRQFRSPVPSLSGIGNSLYAFRGNIALQIAMKLHQILVDCLRLLPLFEDHYSHFVAQPWAQLFLQPCLHASDSEIVYPPSQHLVQLCEYFIEDYVIKFSFQEYDEIDLLNFSTMISLSLEPMT